MQSLILILTILFFFVSSNSSAEAFEVRVIEGTTGEKETLSRSLEAKKISHQWIDLIISKLEPLVDLNNMGEGQYRVTTDEKGRLVKFFYRVNPLEHYEVNRSSNGKYVARKEKNSLTTELIEVEGEIRSSLARAIKMSGERTALTIAIVEVLAWQMDFSRDAKKGDRFKVLVEKEYKGNQFIRYGIIQGLEYRSGNRIIRAIRYKGKYYNEKGESLGKAFLKVPLRYDYISSGFNHERKHPLMGGVHPHFGADYAAPTGTPIWAIADGIVIFCGSVEGFGKRVILRHSGGFTSYYSHLSRYGPGVKEGIRVKQKQVIGYVGSTGFSTGPHLDFRISKDGQFLDPLKTENFPTGQPICKKEREAFQKKRDRVMTWLMAESLFLQDDIGP